MSDYLDTTRAERLTIAKIVDPSMLDIDTASKMLYRLWDDNFGMSKQTVISAEEAEDIGNDIRAIEAGCHEAVKKARDLDNDAAIAILNAAIANKEVSA